MCCARAPWQHTKRPCAVNALVLCCARARWYCTNNKCIVNAQEIQIIKCISYASSRASSLKGASPCLVGQYNKSWWNSTSKWITSLRWNSALVMCRVRKVSLPFHKAPSNTRRTGASHASAPFLCRRSVVPKRVQEGEEEERERDRRERDRRERRRGEKKWR